MLQIFKAGENVQAHPTGLVKNTPDLVTLSMELFEEMQTKCIFSPYITQLPAEEANVY